METSVVDKENNAAGVAGRNANNMLLGVDSAKGGASLQDAFAKFRDRKIKDIKLQKAARKTCGERTPEFKEALRMKFVEQCKKYIGVPYAERYKAPEDPVAPLYLDCCALVRKAMEDLKDDFGFVIAKWNQAYQMDTLPIEVPMDQLKPGDLVFYCGEYTSKRSKKQKHDCVHVEVWLGGETGEATIGSRFFRGKVSIFPSYKFTSTSWTVTKMHFRSLDTWLNGQCVSHCPEHPWIVPEWNVGKKSIFDTSAEDEDVSAGGEEEDDGEVPETTQIAQCGSCNCVSSASTESPIVDMEGGSGKNATPQPNSATPPLSSSKEDAKPAAPIAAAPVASAPATTTSKKPARVRPAASSSSNEAPSGKSPSLSANNTLAEKKSSTAAAPHTYYVGKSNGWRLVKAALDKMDWQQLPFEYKFSSRFTLKWVERRSDIDYRSHAPGQLVCHIPNNDVITTKTGLLTAMRLYTISKNSKNNSSSSSSSSGPAAPKPLYSPVKKPTVSIPSPNAAGTKPGRTSPSRAHGHSSSGVSSSSNDSFCEGNNSTLSRRSKGISADEDSYTVPRRFANEYAMFAEHVVVPWLPDTYLLDSPADCAAVIKIEEERLASKSAAGSIWIYKPSSYNRGRGIKVVTGLENLRMLCYGVQTNDPETTVAPAKGILQRYIENPLLVPAPASLPVVKAKDVYVPSEVPPGGDGSTLEATASVELDIPGIPASGTATTAEADATIADSFTAVIPPVVGAASTGATEAASTPVAAAAGAAAPTAAVSVASPTAAPVTLSKGTGHKFDVRCFLLIARNDPTYLAYYHPGYARLTLSPYSADPASLSDPTVHLTNAAIQKQGPLYQSMKDFQVQTPEMVADLLRKVGREENAAFLTDGRMDHEMKKCMVDIVKSGLPSLSRKRGFFDLFGCDFMVTDDNELKLLEVNSNPSMSLDNKVLADMLPGIVEGSLSIVLAAQGPDVPLAALKDPTVYDNRSAVLNSLPGKYQLIYNENTKFEYS